jgi:glycosyltransferase involved in cell wall biosynthesis
VSLRVCFVVDSGTDVRLAEGLAERVDLTILARRIRGGREISQAPSRPIDVEVGPAGHVAFALFVARRWLALRRRVDVVLVQGYGPAAAVVNLLGRVSGRGVRMLVCSPVEAYYRSRRAPGSRRPYRAFEYLAIVTFARVNAWVGQGYVALSPYLAGVIRGTGTRRPVDVAPVYGVDRRIFRPAEEPLAAIRARLGLPCDERIVFFSSRVAPEKDAETVLRAIGELAGAGRPVRLLHLSGGHAEFAALATRLGVGERVIAGDAVVPFEPLADCYRASDVCVQASREEGLGFSPLEALACGVPVVASAVGGLLDTIRDGETGWSVPAGDAPALARAIAEVLDHPAEAARRTANGRALVLREFEREVAFDALAGIIRRAAGPMAAGHP